MQRGKTKKISAHLSLLHAENILKIVTERHPEKTIYLMTGLFKAWKKGVSIGHPINLMKIGKSLNDAIITKELKAIFEKMASINAYIKVVDWETI
jgi:hypothetical protein